MKLRNIIKFFQYLNLQDHFYHSLEESDDPPIDSNCKTSLSSNGIWIDLH